ncbi:MAG: hypothetical protein LUD81_02550 [Clostridiales bacterium]|nr:hypothetical protein [Clostridiales bacterium]
MLRISNVKISVKEQLSEDLLKGLLSKKLKCKVKAVKIFRKSIDARKKTDVFYNLTLDFSAENEERLLKRQGITRVKELSYNIKKVEANFRPVVVGFGPGGFTAGLYLAEAGLKPIILERGDRADIRKKRVEAFFKTGVLDTESNVQFGEGGAGTFSDGKLNTGINDPRISYVLKTFVKFGAPEEILYSAKPHVGTDKLICVVQNIRKRIEALGGEVYFNKKVTGIKTKGGKLTAVVCGDEAFNTEAAVFAIGHSARDTFKFLCDSGLPMEQKSFSVGFRIEHSQEFINRAQYGSFAKYLPAADYKLFTHLEGGRGVYTFCMCPGGYVVGAASEEGGVVTNGMSNSGRDGENANSAVLVSVGPEDFGLESPLAGMEFQKALEGKAYVLGGKNYFAPAQNVEDFLLGKATSRLRGVKPTYKPGVAAADFKDLFPGYLYEALRQGLSVFDKKLRGFGADGVLTAVESRSSSPVRLLRDRESLESLGVKGLYPCGEGAGYAGGIMSAAVDGLKCAEKISEKLGG